ncbi:hypothetical protein ACFLRY_03490 [Bacteroidota bacterium]
MKLESNFTLERYGLFVRLVNVSDAKTIIDLRADPRARFMNPVGEDIDKQIGWIKEYKQRELAGLDYYFIYYYNNLPVGLNRIYNIQKDSFIGGSLVFKKGCEFDLSMLATLIQFYIGFEILDKSVSFGNIKKDNASAIKFNRLLESDFIYEDETEVFLILTKKIFLTIKKKFESILIS